MKRFFLVGALISLIFCTSGCVKTSYNIEIDKKNNIILSETDSYNQNMLKSLAKDQKALADLDGINNKLEKDKENLKTKGYTVTDYENNGFVGLTASKKYPKNSLKESDLPIGFISFGKSPLLVEKGFFKTSYTINLKYDPDTVIKENSKNYLPSDTPVYQNVSSNNDMSQTDETAENPQTEEDNEQLTAADDYENTAQSPQVNEISNPFIDALFKSSPDLKPSIDLTIKIPYKAVKNNATKIINENEYFWELKDRELTDINITYEKYNYGNIITMILLLLFLAFAGIYYKKTLNTSSW